MLNDLLNGLMSDSGNGWVTMLSEKFGFSPEQAQKFIPAVMEQVSGLVAGGKIDLSNGFDASAILGMLNSSKAASAAGVEQAKADAGLQSLIPEMLSSLEGKMGGADGLSSLLGKDGLGGALGKLF